MKQADKNKNPDQRRIIAMAAGVTAALVLILILHFVLPGGKDGKESQIAALLLDRGGLTYPFSIQNMMWIVFFVGMGELWLCLAISGMEYKHLRAGYLPEDDETVLMAEDLPPIYRRVKKDAGGLFLTRLIRRVILQFQTSRAADQANALLNSSLDLFLHEIDLRYNMLRYIMWLLPTLGFIGTVQGISNALAFAGAAELNDPSLLSNVTVRLALAFNTTLLALVMAGILVFAMHIIQGREERALNMAGQYCLDNLINRLYET